MNDTRTKVYRAHIHERYSEADGISVFCHYGHLSPCGEWVELGDTRWRRTDEWHESEAAAEASLAPRIAEIGARLIRQASELLSRAEVAS